MKTRINLLAIFLLLGFALPSQAQNYPADPTLVKIITDIKKDPRSKEMMISYGYNPSDIDKGTYRNAKKSELKDYFYTDWYGRSDEAYKVSLNKNYRDERYFAIFLTTPKDVNGVSHKIFFKVQYNRRTPQDFEDTKWNYEWLVLDPRENVSYGLPKISDEERKQLMMKYVMDNLDTQYDLKSWNHIVRKIVQIDSILAPSNSIYHYKPLGAGKFYWALSIRGTYAHDTDDDGGVEQTRRGYFKIGAEAVYKNGKYEISGLYNIGDFWDTDAKGWQAMYDAGLSVGVDYEDDPVWMETVATVGFEKLVNKAIVKEQPKGSKAYLTKRLAEMKEAFKSLDSGDADKITKALKPFMLPSKADELAKSYVALVQDYEKKMCTLKVYRTEAKIPYRFELGDTEGPELQFGMSVKRESARTKELKKKYKAAGMSSSVLKSTSRGSEYGLVNNTSYSPNIPVIFAEGNWYINTPADMEEAKVKF